MQSELVFLLLKVLESPVPHAMTREVPEILEEVVVVVEAVEKIRGIRA